MVVSGGVSVQTSNNAERLPELQSSKHVPAEELARRQGIRSFESDEELDGFLADLYATRRASMV